MIDLNKAKLRIEKEIKNTGQNKESNEIEHKNKTGYKGVKYRQRLKCYEAYTKVNGKRVYIGSYKTAEQAGNAYNEIKEFINKNKI